MNAEAHAQDPARRSRDGRDLARQRSAVGVAQRDDVGAGVFGGAERGRGVFRVLLEAVERVLGVIDDEPAVLLEKAHGVGNHVQVLVRRRLQHLADVQQRGFPEDRHYRGAGVDQELHLVVRGGRRVFPARRSERRQPRVPERAVLRFGEELDVLRIGAGPAALDVVHAKGIEPFGDAQLVGDGKRDAVPLRAVAQRRVVDFDLRRHARRVFPSQAARRATAAGCRRTSVVQAPPRRAATLSSGRRCGAFRNGRGSENTGRDSGCRPR